MNLLQNEFIQTYQYMILMFKLILNKDVHNLKYTQNDSQDVQAGSKKLGKKIINALL